MNIYDQLKRDEGNIPHAYQDNLGYWTIGVGFLIDKRKGGEVPPVVADYWLQYNVGKIQFELNNRLSFFCSLDKTRQDCLVNMAYNLGVAGLLSFKRTLRFVENGEYEKASVEMLDSIWARQVGDRAVRLSKQMKTGKMH